jgi:hypothetical protein
MAWNGTAESGLCSGGQWGAADGRIGHAPAVSFGKADSHEHGSVTRDSYEHVSVRAVAIGPILRSSYT